MRLWLATAMASAALAQSGAKPSSIAGTVTNRLTGEPVLRAHVMVVCATDSNPQDPRVYGALTNEEGKFSITQLPAGNCTLSVERVGFVAPSSGDNYQLTAGTQKEGVKLSLTPTGAVTGRVLDGAGEPMHNVRVMVQGAGGSTGTATDEKGQYRVGGLRPGKYRVRASPQQMGLPPEIRSDGTKETHDSATYYPDSLNSKTAQRLEVKAGAEVSGIDIRLVRTPMVTVSGKVTGLPAGFQNTMVMASPAQQGSAVKADGSFAMWRLDPGKYTLVATSYGARERVQSAPLEIEVTTVNQEHLELRMIPAFQITGQVRYEDARPQPEASTPVILNAVTPAGDTLTTTLSGDDSFTLENVQPGTYRVSIGRGKGYVTSVRMGNTEMQGDVLDVRNGPAGAVTVMLSSHSCEVTGKVANSEGPVAGVPVVLAPADEPARLRATHTDSNGVYKFEGLAPGKYNLAAVDSGGIGPETLEDYEDIAVSLDLGPADKATKDLKRRQ